MESTLRNLGRCGFVALFVATLSFAQQPASFNGNWQMDAGKSQVNDGRVVDLTISTIDNNSTLKMTIKSKTKDGVESSTEFTAKTNGKACEYNEGSHKSTLTVWYDGPTLNVCKENGPPTDVTSIWKLDISPDKQTLTMKIAHYEPAAADETLVLTKKLS